MPGLLVMLGFNLVLFVLSFSRIRFVPDRESRIMLAAIAAPLFAMFASLVRRRLDRDDAGRALPLVRRRGALLVAARPRKEERWPAG